VSDLNILLKLLAAAGGAPINPATSEKQDTANTSLATLLGKDFSTETTLAAVNANLATALIKLNDIFGAVDGLELTAGNIELNGAEIGLNTDEVEAILRTIRDNLGLTSDVEATADGTLIAVLKRVRTLLGSVASQATLAQVLAAVSKTALIKNTFNAVNAGDSDVRVPTSGKRIRLYYFGYSARAGVDGVEVALKLEGFNAGAAFDQQYLVAAGQPFARNIMAGNAYIEGSVNGKLIVNLGAAKPVAVNYELEEV
jgi:hypothetical protein